MLGANRTSSQWRTEQEYRFSFLNARREYDKGLPPSQIPRLVVPNARGMSLLEYTVYIGGPEFELWTIPLMMFALFLILER